MAKDRVCVLETDRLPLVLRANPTKTAVRQFVDEHMRRFVTGAPGGWNTHLGAKYAPDTAPAHELVKEIEPAYCIYSATFYDSEDAYKAGAEGTPLDITKLLAAIA